MIPESKQSWREKKEKALVEIDALAEKTATEWTAEKSGAEILEEMREERDQLLLRAASP